MLEEEQHKFLLEEARSKGISLSEAIRRLIEEKQREISQKAIAGPADYLHHDKVTFIQRIRPHRKNNPLKKNFFLPMVYGML
jgi:predicted CopG family antitoxin